MYRGRPAANLYGTSTCWSAGETTRAPRTTAVRLLVSPGRSRAARTEQRSVPAAPAPAACSPSASPARSTALAGRPPHPPRVNSAARAQGKTTPAPASLCGHRASSSTMSRGVQLARCRRGCAIQLATPERTRWRYATPDPCIQVIRRASSQVGTAAGRRATPLLRRGAGARGPRMRSPVPLTSRARRSASGLASSGEPTRTVRAGRRRARDAPARCSPVRAA